MCKNCSKCKCKIKLGIEDLCRSSEAIFNQSKNNTISDSSCVSQYSKPFSTKMKLRLIREKNQLDLNFATSVDAVLVDSIGRSIKYIRGLKVDSKVSFKEEFGYFVDSWVEIELTDSFLNVQVDGVIGINLIINNNYLNFSNVISKYFNTEEEVISKSYEVRGINGVVKYGPFPLLDIRQDICDHEDERILNQEPPMERMQGKALKS